MRNDGEGITWKQISTIVAIVAILWTAAFGIGGLIYYTRAAAASLETRVAVIENNQAAMKAAQDQLMNSQAAILQSQGEIKGMLRNLTEISR